MCRHVVAAADPKDFLIDKLNKLFLTVNNDTEHTDSTIFLRLCFKLPDDKYI